DTALNAILVDSLPGTASIGRLDSIMMELRVFSLRHILAETPEEKSQLESALVNLTDKFQSELKAYEKTITTPRDREQFGKLALPLEHFNRSWAKVQTLSHALQQK